MICEKCGKKIDGLNVNVFNFDGSDSDTQIPIDETSKHVAIIELEKNWTGYELSEEEQRDTITCPYCKQYPFEYEEIDTYEFVRVVCYKKSIKKVMGIE